MLHERRVPLAIDLTRLLRRTVTSFYSNLVTRPTGRAVRMGVESQIAELEGEQRVCLSVLDFSQVRVIDYSCADEIVAKLLLRFQPEDRPAEAFFLARGLHEHHHDPVEAVLETHGLLLAVDDGAGYTLMGPSDPMVRACWARLLLRGNGTAGQVASDTGLPLEAAEATLQTLVSRRVAVQAPTGAVYPLPSLLAER